MIHTVAMQFALLTHRDWSTACRTAGEKCGLKRKQRLMAHPPDAVKPTPWGEQPPIHESEATMSERYTVRDDPSAKPYVGFVHDGDMPLFPQQCAKELNRLAAQVATLRELLTECLPIANEVGYDDLAYRIDAALADTETPG